MTHEVGVAIMPEYRDRGIGTQAQRVLVRYVFEHTTANRLEALTNDANIARAEGAGAWALLRKG